MLRKASILILALAVIGALVILAWPRPRRQLAPPGGMQYVGWAMHACYGLNHVGEQVTTVLAGGRKVTSRVKLEYCRPGLTHLHYLNGPLRGVEVWEDLHRIYRYLPDK